MATRTVGARSRTVGGRQTRSRVARALYSYAKEHGRPPTLREVCEAVELHSLNAAWYQLQGLRAMGVVRHLGGARGYVLADNWAERLYQSGEATTGDAAR